MVATGHNMSDGREERVAKYKEDRRRELEARYGHRLSPSNPTRQHISQTNLTRNQNDNHLPRSPLSKTFSETRSPSDNIRSTRASRLRTRTNQIAQGHHFKVSVGPECRPRSVDPSSKESFHEQQEDLDKTRGVGGRWRVKQRNVTPSSAPSHQNSANSSPSNDCKSKAKYVAASRSLSPGSMSSVLGQNKSFSKVSSVYSSVTSSMNRESSPSIPKSSHLVKKANRVSPGRRRGESCASTNQSPKYTSRSSSFCHAAHNKSSSQAPETPPLLSLRHHSISSRKSQNNKSEQLTESQSKFREIFKSDDRSLVNNLLNENIEQNVTANPEQDLSTMSHGVEVVLPVSSSLKQTNNQATRSPTIFSPVGQDNLFASSSYSPVKRGELNITSAVSSPLRTDNKPIDNSPVKNLEKQSSPVKVADGQSCPEKSGDYHSLSCVKLVDNEVPNSSPSYSPVRHPASILKKSSIDETSSQPVSILKRKSSRDEGSGCVSPVRWNFEDSLNSLSMNVKPRATVIVPASALSNLSNSIMNNLTDCRTSSLALSRGILKKHRSLDEPPPHTLIIESAASSLNDAEETRPILKGQGRRCSLEEMKRNRSPEALPHSILKRKTSSGNMSEEILIYDTDHPHGILKRKGSSPVGSNPDSPIKDWSDDRKPILKKLSCEEWEPILECSHPPRPILKKKSIDDEEHQVKPILKTKYDDSNYDVKSILKQDKVPPVVLRSNSVRSSYQNRRSLDANFIFSPSQSPDNNQRPLSIAERILHLESNIDQELQTLSGRSSRMEEGDLEENASSSHTRSGSVSERASMWNKLEQQSRDSAHSNNTRPNKVQRGKSNRSDVSRFNTQPVTLDEVEQARRNNQEQQQQLLCVEEDDEPSRLSLAERVRLFSKQSLSDLNQQQVTSCKSQLPPTSPRRAHSITHSSTSSIVSGLLKNLKEKAGSTGVAVTPGSSSKSIDYSSDEDDAVSSDSSDSDSERSISVSPPSCKTNKSVGMVGGGGVVVRRCATEPMDRVRGSTPATVSVETASPSESSKDIVDENDGAPVITIAERLAALQRSGSTDWRKRVKHKDNSEPNGGVADRLGKLETATQGWKSRVEPKDNIKFTVKGKMGSLPSSPVTLLPPQLRPTPQPQIFAPQGLESLSTPVSPDIVGDNLLGFIKRSASAPGSDHLKRILNGTGCGESPGPVVTVPEVCDEEFHSFFPDYSPLTNNFLQNKDYQDIDFEHLSNNSTQLLVSKRKVRVQRKHHSANPLRALAQRSDLTSEYVEVRSGIAEKERIRLNIDKLSKVNPGLAVEALAGLASKEELTSVILRRSCETGPVKQVAQWSHPLLLRTKGRRHPVTCIVAPHYTSVNQGDAFTLVTSNQVYCWTGNYCNVIEKARANEVSSVIQNNKDMGCLSASKVYNLDSTQTSSHHQQFWKILNLPKELFDTYRGEEAGHPEEDELYEAAISQSYRVYELSEGKLIPVEQAWAKHPKIEYLHNSKVMVFDFVTEIFCWCGKGSSVIERKQGLKLAVELSKESGWSPSGIPWLDQEMQNKRANVYSVTQHMEPILFSEKFIDWPDFNRNYSPTKSESECNSDSYKACDIKSILDWNHPQPDLVLETSHLGRANKYYDQETRRYNKVATQDVKIWRIEDYAPVEVPSVNFGHFIDTHSYILQWKYTLTVTGRELSGEPSKYLAVGRDRIAFWTWQGKHAGLEAGAASLISVGMQQGAPQVTVKEGLEPPALQSLVPSPALVIHSEKLSSFPKLYIIEPGQDPTGSESPLIRQISPLDSNLRSAASFLYIPRDSCSTVYLWHGCSTKIYHRKICYDSLSNIFNNYCDNFNLVNDCNIKVTEITEGNEPKDFFNGVILRKSYKSEYYNNSDSSCDNEIRLKLFELTHVKGVYSAVPVAPQRFNPDNSPEQSYRYVYSQEELYNTVSQCVIVDASPHYIWLWLRNTSPIPSPQALTTQLSYSLHKNIEMENVGITCQGYEPLDFRCLFPWWNEDICEETVEGWCRGEIKLSFEEISKFNMRTYSLTDLTSPQLPAGVNPYKLELYLSELQFQEIFNMSLDEFQSLPTWQQKSLKKSASLL